jgi:hypothetical protein
MGACEEARPFGQEEVVKMSQTSSAETGKPTVWRVYAMYGSRLAPRSMLVRRGRSIRERGSSQGDVAPSPGVR